jgi:AraC family transcriptional regulator, transcriptional activator FtrA
VSPVSIAVAPGCAAARAWGSGKPVRFRYVLVMTAEVVALLVDDGVSPFEVGIAAEVFGDLRPELDWHRYRLRLAAPRPGRVATSTGFALDGAGALETLRGAGTVVVAPVGRLVDEPVAAAVVTELRAACARGARIVSLCTGAFVLAKAGLLDGLTATTHWQLSDRLARDFPRVRVEPNVLYVDNGQVLTSAGAAAALDLCLHLVRRDHGTAAAAQLARRIVVSPHRAGGQAQFVEVPVVAPGDRGLAELLAWALEHLHQPIGLAELAARAAVSPRTLARRFAEQLGTAPGRWLRAQRLDRARQLLETTGDTHDVVAAHAGLGTGANLRKAFRLELAMTPAEYRRLHRASERRR